MKKIPLTQGGFALIDDKDYELVTSYKWHFILGNRGIKYAYTTKKIFGQIRSFGMHGLILGFPRLVDHKDGDGLNNTRDNLRIATHSQNAANSRKPKLRRRTLSKYKGVSYRFNCPNNPWIAVINKLGKCYHSKRLATELEAAKEYDRMAIAMFGVYAKLNFPREDYK